MKKLALSFLALVSIGLATQVFKADSQVLPQPGPPTPIACAYNTTPPTLTDGQAGWVQCNSSGGFSSESSTNQILVQVPQTVTSGSAYASGNAVGGWMTIAGATRVSGTAGASGTSGWVQSVVVNSKSLQTTQVDIAIFRTNVTGSSTCTDKTAFAVAAADWDKLVGFANVTAWMAAGTPSVGQAQNISIPYTLSSSTTLYACAITRSTPTYTATTDISIGFNLFRN